MSVFVMVASVCGFYQKIRNEHFVYLYNMVLECIIYDQICICKMLYWSKANDLVTVFF